MSETTGQAGGIALSREDFGVNRVILNFQAVRQLRNSQEALELCDPLGLVIGHFVPTGASHVEIEISEEELDRREMAGGGRSLNEILSGLESRLR